MNKSVLITGASGGIGLAIAKELASSGYELVLHYFRNKPAIDMLASKLSADNVCYRILQFDIRQREQCAEILQNDIDKHGAYYAVIANAGIIRDNAFPAMLAEEWDSVINTNLNSFYNILHPVVMPMVRAKKGGRIITIASVSGIMGNRGQTNYSAAKGGIIAATKSLAIELAKRKITVNCVAPGIIETEMSESVAQEAINMVPLRRAGKAEEVAGLVEFLISEKASYITRQVISVNGGMF